jgi:hypothetical protein
MTNALIFFEIPYFHRLQSYSCKYMMENFDKKIVVCKKRQSGYLEDIIF